MSVPGRFDLLALTQERIGTPEVAATPADPERRPRRALAAILDGVGRRPDPRVSADPGPGTRRGRFAWICGLVAATALLGPPSAGAGPGVAVRHCTAAQLRLGILDIQGAAGARYLDIALRNTGRAKCELHGYPGVGLLDSRGRALPTKVVRQSGQPTPVVSVAFGASGYFTVGYESAGPCQPHEFAAYGFEVYPPNDVSHLVVRTRRFSVCAVSVGGSPTVYPIRASKELG